MDQSDHYGAEHRKGVGFTSQRRRNQMVNVLREQGITDPEVLGAMRLVPRHLFVDEAIATRSYDNTALPIGCGQTISQPYIVARMTELVLHHQGAEHRPQKILEIGTGSGYQAAIFSMLCEKVVTVECIEELHQRSRETLRRLNYHNVICRLAERGQWGEPAEAPYDAVVVTAATEFIPRALFAQLKPGGLLLAPVGRIDTYQHLQAHVTGTTDQQPNQVTEYEAVRFVPLVS